MAGDGRSGGGVGGGGGAPFGGGASAAEADRWWWLPGVTAGAVAAVGLPLLSLLTVVYVVAPLALTFGGAAGCPAGVTCLDPGSGSVVARVAAFAVGFGGLLVGSAWLLVKAFGAPHTRERRVRRWWYAVGSLACLGVVGWVYFSPASPL